MAEMNGQCACSVLKTYEDVENRCWCRVKVDDDEKRRGRFQIVLCSWKGYLIRGDDGK